MDAPARLRIAWVLDVWDGVKTGGVVSARRFVEALRERHEVTVVTSGPAGPGRVSLPAFYPPPFRRVMREMGFVFAVPRRRVLLDVLRGVDLVHVQFPFWLGVRTAALAGRLGTPLVAGFHVQPENMYRNVGLRSEALSALTYRFFGRTLYEKADAVVCPTAFAVDELRRHGIRTPAEVVSNGIAPEFRRARGERPERHRGAFLVLAVGRLAREKRLDVVIEGVRRSRHADEIQLVITGRGPEEARVRRAAATLPRPAEVTFVPDAELRRLLGSADLLVHASEVELEGMAVVEALGCGTPALVADAPLSASRGYALSPDLLFRPGDPDDLARRLDRLVEEPAILEEARARIPEAARPLALDAQVATLEALYRRVLARRRRAPLSAAARAGRSTGIPAAR